MKKRSDKTLYLKAKEALLSDAKTDEDIDKIYFDISIIILNYIAKHQKDNNILDTILDFCEKYDMEPELIGDILSNNNPIKKILLMELKENKIIKTENKLASLFSI